MDAQARLEEHRTAITRASAQWPGLAMGLTERHLRWLCDLSDMIESFQDLVEIGLPQSNVSKIARNLWTTFRRTIVGHIRNEGLLPGVTAFYCALVLSELNRVQCLQSEEYEDKDKPLTAKIRLDAQQYVKQDAMLFKWQEVVAPGEPHSLFYPDNSDDHSGKNRMLQNMVRAFLARETGDDHQRS
jgi:hypothetical protein